MQTLPDMVWYRCGKGEGSSKHRGFNLLWMFSDPTSSNVVERIIFKCFAVWSNGCLVQKNMSLKVWN